MNLAETAMVLAKAAAFDRRTVGENDIRAWHETINDLFVADALAAVSRWYRDRSDWLMPSHLRETVRLLRAEVARDARIAAAEARGLPAAQEAVGKPMSALAPEVQEALRSAASGSQGGRETLWKVVAERWPRAADVAVERHPEVAA